MATVENCAAEWKKDPALGPLAFFDAKSPDHQCKELYKRRSKQDDLVQTFCNRYPKDKLPERCKCYRFKDTPDWNTYTQVWDDLVSDDKGGFDGDPLLGSYACYSKACQDPDSYKTREITRPRCPNVVYCKQGVGSVNMDGKSLGQVTVELKQECGKGGGDPKDPNDPNDQTAKGIPIAVYVGVGIAAVVLALLAFAMSRRQGRVR
jgi:hypothetical protein